MVLLFQVNELVKLMILILILHYLLEDALLIRVKDHLSHIFYLLLHVSDDFFHLDFIFDLHLFSLIKINLIINFKFNFMVLSFSLKILELEFYQFILFIIYFTFIILFIILTYFHLTFIQVVQFKFIFLSPQIMIHHIFHLMLSFLIFLLVWQLTFLFVFWLVFWLQHYFFVFYVVYNIFMERHLTVHALFTIYIQ